MEIRLIRCKRLDFFYFEYILINFTEKSGSRMKTKDHLLAFWNWTIWHIISVTCQIENLEVSNQSSFVFVLGVQIYRKLGSRMKAKDHRFALRNWNIWHRISVTCQIENFAVSNPSYFAFVVGEQIYWKFGSDREKERDSVFRQSAGQIKHFSFPPLRLEWWLK